MGMQDTVDLGERGAAGTEQESHVVIDRFEMNRSPVEQEEAQAMAGAALYEQAIRAWMGSDAPAEPEDAQSEEELEAMSQELKLRQKCLEIAALIQADEQALLDGGAGDSEDK